MKFFYLLTTIIIIITSIHYAICISEQFSPEVKLVSVLFRHGDRTPEILYPNLHYKNQDYYPEGLAGLTNKGKLRAYQLGEILRRKYDDFLGTTYVPDDVYAHSTDFDRTKMTLQLVLAGLYPPNSRQKWKSDLNWQPIPVHYIPGSQDNLLNRVYICKSIDEEQDKVKRLPEVSKRLTSYENLMKNLTLFTGRNITNSRHIFTLYCDLVCLKSMGSKLPTWSDDIFPEGQFLEAGITRLELVNYNDVLKRLNGGPLVRKISEDVAAVRNNTAEKKRKIFLYSSHDINIYAMLAALNVVEPHIPEFTSAVIIELLFMDGSYFVKIWHYLGIPSETKELQIPNCSSPCPLDNFFNLTNNVIPSNEELKCT